MIKNLKEIIVGRLGSLSGVTSILGSWQVCHNVCLALIALLSIIGITLIGMPLLFLTKIAVPVWTLAFVLVIITIILYIKKRKCISGKLILFNAGLIIAGVPFSQLQNFRNLFWILGGALALIAVLLYAKGKIQKRRLK